MLDGPSSTNIFENNCWYFRIYDIKYGVPTDREIEFPDDESSTGW